jgi:hypothetical protein
VDHFVECHDPDNRKATNLIPGAHETPDAASCAVDVVLRVLRIDARFGSAPRVSIVDTLLGGARSPMTDPKRLIHQRTVNAFREHCSDAGTLRVIEQVFDDERLEPEPWSTEWDAPGQRRGMFDRYVYRVDWSDPTSVRAVLNAFEEIYTWDDGEWADGVRERLRVLLERDGYRIDARGRIRSAPIVDANALPLDSLRDPSAILDHLERIADARDRDPALAISGSKALIEATAKLVLVELNEPYSDKADIPTLVKSAQKALKLDPQLLAPTAPGIETTKRLLSNLSQVALGIAN